LRPALCTKMPTLSKSRKGTKNPLHMRQGVHVLDLGANMDSKPENLVQFAVMSDVYLRAIGYESPRIGLLSVGTEDEKGNELTKTALASLKTIDRLNFKGNMEARDTFSGNFDIVVCDGFVGNVLLKTLEGGGKLFSNELKRVISHPLAILGKLILAPHLLKMKKNLSEDAIGGAFMLGLKKPVLKAHGNASQHAFSSAILLAAQIGETNLGDKITEALKDL